MPAGEAVVPSVVTVPPVLLAGSGIGALKVSTKPGERPGTNVTTASTGICTVCLLPLKYRPGTHAWLCGLSTLVRSLIAESNWPCSASPSTGVPVLPWQFAHTVLSIFQVWFVPAPVMPAGNAFMWQPTQVSCTARCADGL